MFLFFYIPCRYPTAEHLLSLLVSSVSKMALNGKIAVVTGAAMGIGKAITEILLQNGAKVNIHLSYAAQFISFVRNVYN